MNFENVPQKQMNDIERLVRELQLALRKAGLQQEPLAEQLRMLEAELGELRRKNFDANNSEYHAY